MTERIGNFLIVPEGDFWLLTDLGDGEVVGTYDTEALAREAVDRITDTDSFEAFIRAEREHEGRVS